MLSVMPPYPFLKFHSAHGCNPSSNNLYPKFQGKDPSPSTHYSSYLGNGALNRESHPPTLGLEGELLGPVLSRQPKGFLILPTPALKPQAPSPQTCVREGNLLAPAYLT